MFASAGNLRQTFLLMGLGFLSQLVRFIDFGIQEILEGNVAERKEFFFNLES